jgi:hypothetical protein
VIKFINPVSKLSVLLQRKKNHDVILMIETTGTAGVNNQGIAEVRGLSAVH